MDLERLLTAASGDEVASALRVTRWMELPASKALHSPAPASGPDANASAAAGQGSWTASSALAFSPRAAAGAALSSSQARLSLREMARSAVRHVAKRLGEASPLLDEEARMYWNITAMSESEAVDIGSLALSMPFDQIFAERTLEKVAVQVRGEASGHVMGMGTASEGGCMVGRPAAWLNVASTRLCFGACPAAGPPRRRDDIHARTPPARHTSRSAVLVRGGLPRRALGPPAGASQLARPHRTSCP